MRQMMITIGPAIRSASVSITVLALAQAFSTHASAGLLDFLFAAPPQHPQVVAQPPRMTPIPTMASPRARSSRPAVVRKERTGPRPYVAPERGAGPLGPFLHDPTLRRGDVVATAQGLMVFQGKGGGTNHKPSDFAAVTSATSKADELKALDQAMRRTPSVVEEVSVAMDNQLPGLLGGRARIAGVQ